MKNSHFLIWGLFRARGGAAGRRLFAAAAQTGRAAARRRCWSPPAFTTNVPVQIQPQPVGHVVAYSTVTIRPQIGGILQQVHFKEGAEVKSNATAVYD